MGNGGHDISSAFRTYTVVAITKELLGRACSARRKENSRTASFPAIQLPLGHCEAKLISSLPYQAFVSRLISVSGVCQNPWPRGIRSIQRVCGGTFLKDIFGQGSFMSIASNKSSRSWSSMACKMWHKKLRMCSHMNSSAASKSCLKTDAPRPFSDN